MAPIITDLKNDFRRASISQQFIYINCGIFVVTALVAIVGMLFNVGNYSWMEWLELPAWLPQFIKQPWSLVTYMFLHAGLFHLLFNMLWLYSFGQLFLMFFSARHFRGLYFLGGFCGGLLYMLAYNVFPYFSSYLYGSYLLGASASVIAIVIATAIREPEFRVSLLFFGQVRLKYLALIMIITDLLFVTSNNAGGHIAHLGGALAGWWFAVGLRKGTDVTKWINQAIDWLLGGWKVKRAPKKPKMKVHYGGRANDYEYNARKKEQDEEVDRILDKLKKSGYGSLTTEEKKRLFDASKR
ncbi:MAG: rhomboid family intramembrane serine protease [Bacteroidaceae bacterium]|nr:rhomboid family intramembrane serine protease [Bacteroidaceae bacterium]